MRSQEETHAAAKAIVTRLVTNAIQSAFSRSLIVFEGVTEEDVIQDCLDVAMGVDIGCLDEDDLTPENIDVMFVQEELKKAYNDGHEAREESLKVTGW